MKVTERFSIERDAHCFRLIERVPNSKKPGEFKTRETYHGRIDHALNKVLIEEGMSGQPSNPVAECVDTIQALQERLKQVAQSMEATINAQLDKLNPGKSEAESDQ